MKFTIDQESPKLPYNKARKMILDLGLSEQSPIVQMRRAHQAVLNFLTGGRNDFCGTHAHAARIHKVVELCLERLEREKSTPDVKGIMDNYRNIEAPLDNHSEIKEEAGEGKGAIFYQYFNHEIIEKETERLNGDSLQEDINFLAQCREEELQEKIFHNNQPASAERDWMEHQRIMSGRNTKEKNQYIRRQREKWGKDWKRFVGPNITIKDFCEKKNQIYAPRHPYSDWGTGKRIEPHIAQIHADYFKITLEEYLWTQSHHRPKPDKPRYNLAFMKQENILMDFEDARSKIALHTPIPTEVIKTTTENYSQEMKWEIEKWQYPKKTIKLDPKSEDYLNLVMRASQPKYMNYIRYKFLQKKIVEGEETHEPKRGNSSRSSGKLSKISSSSKAREEYVHMDWSQLDRFLEAQDNYDKIERELVHEAYQEGVKTACYYKKRNEFKNKLRHFERKVGTDKKWFDRQAMKVRCLDSEVEMSPTFFRRMCEDITEGIVYGKHNMPYSLVVKRMKRSLKVKKLRQKAQRKHKISHEQYIEDLAEDDLEEVLENPSLTHKERLEIIEFWQLLMGKDRRKS